MHIIGVELEQYGGLHTAELWPGASPNIMIIKI
jgi:hypothetical protein